MHSSGVLPTLGLDITLLNRDYQTCSMLDSNHKLLLRKDQQVIRALSNNMQEHSRFFSTPKLVSDLLFVSDLLKQVEDSKRNYCLGELIQEINKNLPANVYIPIKSSTVHEFAKCLKNGIKKAKRQTSEGSYVMHRVVGLSSYFAFCLHSKERVPYHIILKVVFAQNPHPKTPEKKLPLLPGQKQK
jgi:hypothetical protein